MDLIADILLAAGALGAGLYCFVLARRLRRFTDLETGVGGAVSVLSAQADELKRSLDTARASSDQSGLTLRGLTERAEAVAQRLDLMMASMHDIAPEKPAEPEIETEPLQEEPPETPAEEETGEAEPPGEDQNEAVPEPKQAPEGLMFFRHTGPKRGGGS